MKVQAPESALNVLRDILANNQDKPQNVRVYFAGFVSVDNPPQRDDGYSECGSGCSGCSGC